MRLTLRTLLAYMDDVLDDPADHEELGRKIEASDFATELIHRSRDAARRLRLGAPEPTAGDAGDLHGGTDELDANMMAQYLDNENLSPEEVAEFERACLAAGDRGDMLLAEAVSCHHILTMVLGEPAEVDPDLRGRIYKLGHTVAKPGQSLRIEPAHEPERAATPAVDAAAAAPAAAGIKPTAATVAHPDELPEYLRAAADVRRKKRRMMLATVAAMAGGAAAFWLFMDQEIPEEMAKIDTDNLVIEGAPEAPGAQSDATPEVGGGDAPPFVPPTTTQPQTDDDDAGDEPDNPFAGAGDDPAHDQSPAMPADESPEAVDLEPAMPLGNLPTGDDEPEAPPVDPLPGDETIADNGVGPIDSNDATASDAGMAPGGLIAAEPLDPAMGADDLAESPFLDTGESPADALPDATDNDNVAMAAGGSSLPRLGNDPLGPADADPDAAMPPSGLEPPAALVPDDGETVSPEPQIEQPLGAYLGMMGAYDVLLGYDAAAGQWRRLPPNTPLADEVQLLTLPTFRTMVNLRDANIYMAGGTQMTVAPADNLPGDPAADLAVRLPRGRLIINAGLNGNRFELIVTDRSYFVELEPSSTLAIEVRGLFTPGLDPSLDAAPRIVDWYLTTGSGSLTTAADRQPLIGPTQLRTSTDGDTTGKPLDEAPEWINREVVTDNQRRAQKEIAPALQPGAPVNIALLEFNDPDGAGRRYEVRTLASQCAAYVGVFEPLVKSLNDAQQRAYWKQLIATLRSALAEDPNAAPALEEALTALRGERDAAALMELIRGYSPAEIGATREEIQAGPVAGVLRSLESDDLDFRVLAYQNLCDLTGTTGLGYRPEQRPEQRERKLRVIWNRFKQHDLLPQQAEP